MRKDRLSDAAIALHRAFTAENVKYGIFGGYAVSILGGPRDSKDVDCIAALSKEQVVSILSRQPQFTLVPQTRTDYVAFFWNDDPRFAGDHVFVEVFTEKFPGKLLFVTGSKLGKHQIAILYPFTIFKGKLRATATRSKFSDTVDLRWLEGNFPNVFQQNANQLNLEDVGKSIKNYPELELLFRRIGVDIEAAKAKGANTKTASSTPQHGGVQRGILGA
ncbi:MAG: hypothetical protein Q9161_001567 [Pseudevernia consocians]